MNNKYLCNRKRNNNDIENVLKEEEYINNNININNEKNNLITDIIKENKNSYFVKSHNNQYNNNKNNTYIKNNHLPKFEPRTENKNKNFIKTKTTLSEHKYNSSNNTPKKLNPYITSVSFKHTQTIDESKNTNGYNTLNIISKKNNKVSFGKSLDETLMHNINKAIMKQGIKIRQIKRKNYSSIIYKSSYSNFNNKDLHKKIFDKKLVEIYDAYQKKMEEYKKQKIEELLPSLEKRRQKMKNNIPLCIKGYRKKDLDIFYTRNVCDLDYQRYYDKNQLNINDILENHNKYNRKEYLSGSVPFFLLTKTVFKPMFRKSISQPNFKRNNNKYTRNIKKVSI